jgi:hypothetical protein
MEKKTYLSSTEMEEKGGVKAQHAVYRALKTILATAGTGWDIEETQIGSRDDRRGIDLWLVNNQLGVRRPLDVAMYDKLAEGKGNEDTMVRVYPSWFDVLPDGSWVLLKEREQALIRALLPTMSAPHVSVRRDH